MQETIYNYVINHLDEHGRFTAANLCDAINETIPRPLGAEDAFYYSTTMESTVKLAQKLAETLRKYIGDPGQKNRSALYNLLNDQIFHGLRISSTHKNIISAIKFPHVDQTHNGYNQ